MSERINIQNDIVQALRAYGPQTRAEIMERCFLVSDASRCGNALTRLKALRLIERGPNKTWQLTGQATRQASNEQEPGDERPADNDEIEPTRTPLRSPTPHEALHKRGDNIQALLLRAAKQAQDALDEYIWQIGDEAILGPLMRSRDAAKQAVDAYGASL